MPRGGSRGNRDGCPARTNGTKGRCRTRGRLSVSRTGRSPRGRGRTPPCQCRRGRGRGVHGEASRAARGGASTRRGARDRASMESLGEGDLESVAHLLELPGCVHDMEATRMLACALEVGLADANEEFRLLPYEAIRRAALRALA